MCPNNVLIVPTGLNLFWGVANQILVGGARQDRFDKMISLTVVNHFGQQRIFFWVNLIVTGRNG